MANASLSQRIRELREEAELSQQDLADRVHVSASCIGMAEQGRRKLRPPALEAIADYFDVDIDYLYGRSNVKRANPIPPGFSPLPQMVKRPLIGRIACGQPILAEENIEGYIDVPKSFHCDFCLICTGDSMIDAKIEDGDIVYIRREVDLNNGDIAAVRIGDEATLKRIYRDEQRNTITLMAANAKYAPTVYTGAELEDVHIEGKAVGFTHCF